MHMAKSQDAIFGKSEMIGVCVCGGLNTLGFKCTLCYTATISCPSLNIVYGICPALLVSVPAISLYFIGNV